MTRNKSPREVIQNLPPNIVNAQPEIMGGVSDRWFKEMLDLRAKRLRVSPEQAADVEAYKTQFEESIEQLAKFEGVTPEAYLEAYARRIGQSTYPTPECLSPSEVLEYAETGNCRHEHVSSCSSCKTLLDASLPSDDGFRRLRDGLRPLAPTSPEELSLQPRPEQELVSLRPGMAWLSRPLAYAAAGVFVLLVISAIWVFRPAPTVSPRVHALAVLPIQDNSPSSDGGYLAYTMTEGLINDLGSVGDLRVIGKNSVMRFEKSNEEPAEIGRILNVDAIAETSIVNEGGRLRMSAQLIKTANNEKLWSGTFKKGLDDALGLQGEVAEKIAREAGVTLSSNEKARLLASPSVPPSVFLMYTEARYRLSTRKVDDIEAALSTFQKAVEEDPEFAFGWASVADSYNLLALRGLKPSFDAHSKAREAAGKALALDPNLANAHAALALNDMYDEFNWGQAENEFRTALRLNPSYGEAHHWYGLLLSALKRHEEAAPQLKLAAELEPLSPPINTAVGDGYFLARHYDQAIDQYNATLKKFPDYAGAKRNLAAVYVQVGRYDEAIRLLNEVRDNKGDLAYAYAVKGKKQEARKLIPELDDPTEIAIVYAALGERNHAFDWLDKAYQKRDFLLFQIAVDPALDSLRSDPRFLTVLRRMNYPNANP